VSLKYADYLLIIVALQSSTSRLYFKCAIKTDSISLQTRGAKKGKGRRLLRAKEDCPETIVGFKEGCQGRQEDSAGPRGLRLLRWPILACLGFRFFLVPARVFIRLAWLVQGITSFAVAKGGWLGVDGCSLLITTSVVKPQ
jgi:hypothetical protein